MSVNVLFETSKWRGISYLRPTLTNIGERGLSIA